MNLDKILSHARELGAGDSESRFLEEFFQDVVSQPLSYLTGIQEEIANLPDIRIDQMWGPEHPFPSEMGELSVKSAWAVAANLIIEKASLETVQVMSVFVHELFLDSGATSSDPIEATRVCLQFFVVVLLSVANRETINPQNLFLLLVGPAVRINPEVATLSSLLADFGEGPIL